MAGALGLVATGGHFHSAPVPNIKVTGTIPSPLSNGILTTTASFTASGGTAPYQFGTTGNLPPGMNIAGNSGIVAGIPTTLGSYTFSVIAIDANGYIGSTSFTIVVAPYLSDTYYLYTTLLINGETNSGTNYIADASTNNFAVTPYGAANPNRFSPLWGNGYYGNYFDGASGTISIPNSTAIILNTGAVPTFTIELWFNSNTLSNNLIDKGSQAGVSVPCYRISCGTSISFLWGDGGGVNYSQYTTSGITINPNTWYHVAVVSNAGVLNIYVNGVSYATGTLPSYGDNGDPLFIGSRYDGDQFYQGYISNLRIVKGTAVYTSNFTPSTTPLTAIANTALLTCQSANFVDNSTNAFTLTPTGTVKVVSNQPFGALPSSVQNYGSSLFDGSTGYINLTGSGIALGTNNFTIEFWAYINAAVSSAAVFFDMRASSSAVAPLIQMYTSNILYYSVGSSNVITGPALAFNQWYHIAVSRVSGSTRMFLNGVQVGSTYTDSNTYVAQTNRPILGSYGDTVANRFNGYMSNVRLINGTGLYTSNFIPPTAPLTAIANTSLLTLQNKNGANNNTFYDDSVNNFPITRTGTPTQGTFTPFSQTGWSNYFDGSTGGINTPVNPTALQLGSNNFTIEAWINLSTTPSGFDIIFGCESVTYDGILFGISTSNTIQINISSNGSTYNLFNGSTFATVIKTNTWTHVALVRNNGTLYAYINGVQDSTTYNISTNSIYFNSVAVGAIGIRPPTQSLYFPGYISNLRVVNGTAVYTTAFTPSTTPLTAITNTSLLTCQSNRFVDNSTNNFAITATGTVQVQAFSPFAPGVSYSSANNGGSMYFSATGNYLYYANNVFNISSGTLQWTFETWVYPTNTNTNFFAIGSGGAYGNSMFCGWSSNNFNFGQGNGGSNPVIIASASGTYYPYAWYHYAVSKDYLGNIRLFINGTQVNTQNYTSTVASGTTAVINGVYDNNGFGNSGGQWYLSGLRLVIGQTLYTSAFTPPTAPLTPTANTSLLLLGTNTGVQDATGKNDIITVGSAKTQANTVKYGTGAMYFDGAGNYLTLLATPLVSAFGSGSFTVEAWIYPTQSGTFTLASSNYNYSSGTGNWSFYFSPGSASLLYFNTTSVNHASSTTTTISLNTWTHMAYSRNGSTAYFFVNGTQVGTTVSDTTNYPSGGLLYIGQQNDGTGSATGYIDDLRITKGIARYTANFTPPTVPDLTS